MRGVLLVFFTLIAVFFLPFAFTSLHDVRTDNYDQSFAEVSTGAGENAANVTLALTLWNDTVQSVSEISSNITGEVPTAAGYNSVSKVLTVGGLHSATDRTLVVTFETTSVTTDEVPAVVLFVIIISVLVVMGVFAFIGAALWDMLSSLF